MCLKKTAFATTLALLAALALNGQAPEGTGNGLGWAFPIPDENQPPAEDDDTPKQLPGSSKSYTMAQIDDQFNPPDWYPDEHATPPSIIVKGIKPSVQACGSCHLMHGLGHSESAYLAGLPAGYFKRQMAAFKNGDRVDPEMHVKTLRADRMVKIAAAISDEDVEQAAEWFASLEPKRWYRVVEADTVPKSYVKATRMRLELPIGGTEPIGNRIIILPEDASKTELRDPHTGFIAYVPPGSVEKGEALVTTGGSGKTMACSLCHGADLKGQGEVPGLAGQNPLYIVRQLYGFQTGAHGGASAAIMKQVSMNLGESDMVEIAAYLTSLSPE